jgi:isopenicillin-N N-acyltransferase-like protein
MEESMATLRTLTAAGAPAELGFAHGRAFRDEITLITEERMRLATDPFWTGGRAASLDEVIALGSACLRAHEAWCPELVDELRGMAEATGLGLNELTIMNGFTDFVDLVAADPNAPARFAPDDPRSRDDDGGCTAFVVAAPATRDGRALIGQTWDMHSSATPHVLLADFAPEHLPRLLTFTLTGCVGMIGMNDAGVAVGINNILGADGRVGVHWPFVVRKMLAQRSVDRALGVLLEAPLSGAHNYILMGPDEEGEQVGYNIEATATRSYVTPVNSTFAHSNHCLVEPLQKRERPRKALSLTSTCNRLEQAERYLADHEGRIDVETLMAMTRLHEEDQMSICAHAHPTYDVESSGACLMRPESRELWALWGLPCQNEYERFVVGEALPQRAAVAPPIGAQ